LAAPPLSQKIKIIVKKDEEKEVNLLHSAQIFYINKVLFVISIFLIY
jgi:hypothetical protein